MTNTVLVIGALIISTALTGLVRLYALQGGLMDAPNQRSSHELPTPRGGGLSIVATFMAFLVLLYLTRELPKAAFCALLLGGGLVGLVGFLDDHRHIPAAYRLLAHVTSACIVVYAVGGLPPVQIGVNTIHLGWGGNALAVVFLVWLTNLFNFMDGIDGIATTETIFIASAAIIIGGAPSGHYLMLLEAGLVAACLGFLVWNWPPARIFMGDVGSGFLGVSLGGLALISASLNVLPIWSWLILASVFLVDATITLVTRVMNAEEWYSAHNNHAYQKASRRLKGHKPVTLSVLMINILWLLPMAWFASARPELGWWLTIVAWLPLISLSLFLKAGRPDPGA